MAAWASLYRLMAARFGRFVLVQDKVAELAKTAIDDPPM